MEFVASTPPNVGGIRSTNSCGTCDYLTGRCAVVCEHLKGQGEVWEPRLPCFAVGGWAVHRRLELGLLAPARYVRVRHKRASSFYV